MFNKTDNPKRSLLLILTMLIIHCQLLIATIRYVSHSGSNTPPYTSWATAADSIMSAINISVFGDTIYVANGVYIEQVTMIHGLTLIGAGIDSCVVDTRTISAPTDYFAVIMKDECSIEGFHIIVRNNQGGTHGIWSSPGLNDSLYFQGRILNNKISKVGVGIISSNSFLIIKNNMFEDVREGIEVGALDTSVLDSIYNNYLFQIIDEGIGTNLAAEAIIHNNFIHMVTNVHRGILLPSIGVSEVFNNLIISINTTGGINSGRTGISLGAVVDEVFNNVVKIFPRDANIIVDQGIRFGDVNIVKNNLVIGGVYGYYLVSSNGDVYYNDAWESNYAYYGFTPDSTNRIVDPMIVNDDTTRGELDLHLQMFSPLINAGDPSILDLDSTRSDIGLYGGPYGESYIYLDLAPGPPVNLSAEVDSNIITINWNRNTEADFSNYNLYRDTSANFIIDSTKFVLSLTDTFYTHLILPGTEKLYYKLTATDNQGNVSAPSEELSVIITSIKEFPTTVSDYKLYQNYPNPFNPSTTIAYKLKEGGYVKLYVYDIKGELVDMLVNQSLEAGYYEVEFSGETKEEKQQSLTRKLASGIYIYQIIVRNQNDIPVFSDIKKMIYLK